MGLLHDPGDQPFRAFLPTLLVILGAYLFFNRAFAWVHIPGVPVFPGELLLAVGLFQAMRVPAALRAVVGSSALARLLLAVIVVGALRTAWDIPTHGLDAVRDAAPWYYGALALILAALVITRPTSIETLSSWYRRAIPLFLLWAPIAVWLSEAYEDVAPLIPDSETPIVAFKPPDIAVHAATALAFLWIVVEPRSAESRRRRIVITVLGLVTVLVAGTQFRSGFVAAVVTLAGAAWLSPQRKQLVRSGLSLVVVIILAAQFLDVRIQLPRREISLEQITSNVLSVFDESEDEGNLQGTVAWRLELWSRALDDLLEDEQWATGVGFGPNLADRYDFLGLRGRRSSQPLRSAHNTHLTMWTRGGLLLAALWLLFWIALLASLWRLSRARDVEGNRPLVVRLGAWVLVSLGGFLVNAFFDPSLEGPHAAVWAWSLAGLGLGTLLLARAPRVRAVPPLVEA
ncbi:MAG: O-antigen ligase family protein [Nitriliruptorales bacterium]|nr:O-antigen ligase family protein [Nitriliruptorales bacterium]